MLVVGGQDGSKSSQVRNMEIDLMVGPAYDVQYLRDTDPYKLYPFMVVLPSSDIFIQYYTEAHVAGRSQLGYSQDSAKSPSNGNELTGG
jgi:hypothetical protein